MRKQALATIAKHDMLSPGDGIIVGLSGGADSVALTHILCNLPDFDLKIICVHIHHGLRGSEADVDAAFCKEFCKRLGIDLVVFSENAAAESRKMGVGIEEAGRILRYDRFNQVLQQYGFSKIAVAHNQNDDTETILMQIVRGTGGIRGIPAVNGNVIRPLVDVSREVILEYCHEHELAYCIDSTNNSNDYSRNWVRNVLLPQLEKNLNPAAGNALRRLAKISADEDAFLDNIAKNAYIKSVKSSKNGIAICLNEFLQYDMAIKRRIIRIALGKALSIKKDITYSHVEAVMLLAETSSGKQVSLPKGYVAKKAYHKICIKIPDISNNFSVNLAKNTPIYVPQIDTWMYLGNKIVCENAFTKVLDCGKITDVHVRTRLPGDRIFFSNVGTKKIKDFFIDNKIVRAHREKAVFIACEEDIILIMGNGFDKPIESHKFNPKNDSNTIYLQIWKSQPNGGN